MKKTNWKQYYEKTKDIHNIPDQFKTKEMIKKYLNEKQDIFNISTFLITEDILKEYVTKYKTLNIPKELHDQKICYHYFNKTKDIKQIPEKYLNKKIIKEYFENYYLLYEIPEKFITQEMANKYFQLTKDIKNIPEKFITQQMCDESFQKNNLNICYFPLKFINQYKIDTINKGNFIKIKKQNNKLYFNRK